MKKRFLSILMALSLALSLLPTAAFAVEEGTSDTPSVVPSQSAIPTNGGALTSGEYQLSAQTTVSGTLTVAADQVVTIDLNGQELTFGEFAGDCFEVKGSLTIRDTSESGKITAVKAIVVDGGTITLESGTINITKDYGVYCKNGGTAVVNGGAITSLYAPLTGNNTTGNMIFEVNGGTLTAKMGPAIYMPGQVTLIITNGTLNGGISLRMGQVKISGGEINAITNDIDSPTSVIDGKPAYAYSGNVWFPDALYVINGTYTSSDGTYGNSLDLEITGGTFTCGNSEGSAVAIYDLGRVAQDSSVRISSGAVLTSTASSRTAYQVVSFADLGVDAPYDGYNNPNNVGKVDTSITGGQFSTDVSAYVDDGYRCNELVDGSVSQGWIVTEIANNELVVEGSVDNGAVTGSLDGKFDPNGTTVTDETDDDVSGSGNTTGVTDNVEVKLTTTGGNATTTTLNVTQATAGSLSEANSLTVQTDAGSVKFDKDALTTIAGKNTSVEIKVTENRDDAGNGVLASYTVEATGDSGNLLPYGGSNNGTVTITVKLPDGKKSAEEVQAWYVTENGGSLSYVESLDVKASATSGYVDVTIGHLSTIVLRDASDTVTGDAAAVLNADGSIKESYTTLQAAINAAQNNETVRLLRSVDLDASGTNKNHGVINISGDKTITLDGNRFTLTAKTSFAATGGGTWDKDLGQYHVINIENGANVTIQDLIIDGDWAGTTETAAGSYNAARTGINIWNTASTSEVKLENVQVNNCSAYAVVAKGADLTINGLTTTGNRWGLDVEDGSTVTIKTANIAEDVVYESSSPTSSLTIHNGTYGTVKVQQQDANKTQGTVSINGGTVATVTTGGDQIANATANVTVTGATVGTVNNTSAGTMSVIDSKITGTAPTAESNVIMLNCTNGSNVKLPDIVPADTKPFLVNGVGYEKLADALAKVSDGGTIVLTKTTPVDPGTTTISKDVTIVGNGYGLTMTAPSTDHAKALILQDNLTLDNVKLTINGDTNGLGDAIQINSNVTLRAENNSVISFNGLQSGFVMPGGTIANVELVNSTLDSKDIDGNFTNGGHFTFTGSTVTIDDCDSYGLSVNQLTVDNSTVTITNVKLAAVKTVDDNASITLQNNGAINVSNSGSELPFGSKWGVATGVVDLGHGSGGNQYQDNGADIPDSAASLTVDSTSSINLNNNTGKEGANVNFVYLTEKGTLDNKGTITAVVVEAAPAGSNTVTVMNGTQTMAVATVADGGSYPLPAAPYTMANHTFAWVCNSTSYAAGTTVNNITSDMTFYAKWTPTGSTGNGGNGGGSSEPSYSPVIDITGNGTIKVSPRTPSEGDEVTITPDPDNGYEVGSVTVTDRSGRTVRVTENRNGTYTFTQPAGRVTIEVTFVRTGENTFFTDVPETFWAYDEIAWAYENGYVNGVTATTFNPNGAISRQQVWMILARLSGYDPADMAAARAWAMENGVSDGTNPGNAVTRQQLVALLFRFAELRNYANDQRADLSVFPDVGTVAEYAVEPMQWSVANDIVGGTTAGTLNPEGTATRAQFAVILYRFWTNV